MKPNILFIFSDQHRHDVLGAAGHPLVATPNLDRLAAEGVRFSETWCQSPICQPSRASVITGRYAADLGVIHNNGGFDPEWPTVMKSLQAVGYETATFGKTHYHDSYETSDPSGAIDMRDRAGYVARFGWDHVMEEYDKYLHASRRIRTHYTEHLAEHGLLDAYREQIKGVFRLTESHWRGETSVLPQEHDLTTFIANRAIDWLGQRDTSRPFLLKLAFVQPHVPLIDDPEWAAHYADADIPLPDMTPPDRPGGPWDTYLERLDQHSQAPTMTPEFIRNGIRHYLGMVSLVDQQVGSVMAALDAAGQLDDTWIIYTCDHGEMLGHHRLWAKMNFYSGAVRVPLIIRPPGGLPGRVADALTELTDVTATIADVAGADAPPACAGASLLPALEGETPGRELVHSRIGQFAGASNGRYRCTVHVPSATPCELFDLEDDPGETRNLVSDAARSGLTGELTAAILRHETGSAAAS